MKMIKVNAKGGEVPFVLGLDLFNQRLGRNALVLRFQHDGGAMRVRRTHIGTVMPSAFLKTNPNIGLDVLQQMPQVNLPVGIGQSASDENVAAGRWHLEILTDL